MSPFGPLPHCGPCGRRPCGPMSPLGLLPHCGPCGPC